MLIEPFRGIIFTKNYIPGINFCNLGKELSSRMPDISANKNMLPSLVEEGLSDIIKEFTFLDEDGLRYIAFENISILFEPDLGINIDSFIEKASKDVCLYIKSDHKADYAAYYPFPGNTEYKISLTDKTVRQKGYTIDN